RQLIGAFLRNRSGSTAIEYVLIASIISIAIFASVKLVGDETKGLFDCASESVAT
ncbi:unnamed protein product, partial [Laminaria digitata]